MSALAKIIPNPAGSEVAIEIQFPLVVDPVLGITPREVRTRALATFGTATILGQQLNVARFPWPRQYRHGQINLRTNVVTWQGVRQSVFRNETLLTDDAHYQRRLTQCAEESFSGYSSTVSTDVITFYADSALPNPLTKLEHELGHALGIRHTYSTASPMYNGSGSSEGSRLTVSDVIDILWQLDPSIHDQWQPLSSRAIRELHASGTVTPASPVAD